MLKGASQKKLITDFEFLKKELIHITVTSQDKKAFQYFDYILWVESKIKNKNMAELTKLKTINFS